MRLHELVDRPNVFVKIPGHRAGPRRDRGLHRRRPLDQHHAHLLARASRCRHRGVPPRARAARRRRRRSRAGRIRRQLLRVSRATPRPTVASTSSGATTSRGSSRSRTRSSPTSSTSTRSRVPRWEALAAEGAPAQRCLWASTSTKNPAYRDVLYVEELIGPDTVNTMPARDRRRLPGSRRGPPTRSPRASRRREGSSLHSPRRASTTTTSWPPSSEKASRSSRSRSASCSTASRRSARRSSPDAAVRALEPPAAQVSGHDGS